MRQCSAALDNAVFTQAAKCLGACRVLKPAPYVLQGLFEMYEMNLVHTYASFADVPLAALLDEAPMPDQACLAWQHLPS